MEPLGPESTFRQIGKGGESKEDTIVQILNTE
jgi:hypothetical protein